MKITIDDISRVLGIEVEAVIEMIETLVAAGVMDPISGGVLSVKESREVCASLLGW